MKHILRAGLIGIVIAMLLVSTGVSSRMTNVARAKSRPRPVIDADAVWDVASTYEVDCPIQGDNGALTYELSSLQGSVAPVYFDTAEVSQDVQDYANSMIADFNVGAISSEITFAPTGDGSYTPVEVGGGYDSPPEDLLINKLRTTSPREIARTHGPSAESIEGTSATLVPVVSKRTGVKAEFKMSLNSSAGASLNKSSMTFNGALDRNQKADRFLVQSSRFNAPGFSFGGGNIKVNDWGKSPKKSINSVVKKEEVQIDFDSVQADEVNGTVSVKQRISLKKPKK